ncbi:hypothetical protein IF1G_00032 [Cordyceps javanica]|uniref:Uncharacterized protein n=1 Tax=Cordyceps javanica TaxID=43265 RepID=A0A545VEF4_9HYPO|nr:hypothetical protein IF1G_00032 [Cordyceps javanica]
MPCNERLSGMNDISEICRIDFSRYYHNDQGSDDAEPQGRPRACSRCLQLLTDSISFPPLAYLPSIHQVQRPNS